MPEITSLVTLHFILHHKILQEMPHVSIMKHLRVFKMAAANKLPPEAEFNGGVHLHIILLLAYLCLPQILFPAIMQNPSVEGTREMLAYRLAQRCNFPPG